VLCWEVSLGCHIYGFAVCSSLVPPQMIHVRPTVINPTRTFGSTPGRRGCKHHTERERERERERECGCLARRSGGMTRDTATRAARVGPADPNIPQKRRR
jgi:hypothetical protein